MRVSHPARWITIYPAFANVLPLARLAISFKPPGIVRRGKEGALVCYSFTKEVLYVTKGNEVCF